MHGRYKGQPNLDFERLKKINAALDIPLALHGGSGISEDDFRKLINYGITKINFYNGNAQSTYKSVISFMETKPLEKGVDVGEFFKNIYESVKRTTFQQMNIFGSCQKI